LKFIKYLVVVFALSVLCVKSGVYAWTYTVYTQTLKSSAGVTEQGQLYKNSLDISN
jgi:phage tail protein X